MTIEIVNINSSVQDHKQNLYHTKVLNEQKRTKKSTRMKLEAPEDELPKTHVLLKTEVLLK